METEQTRPDTGVDARAQRLAKRAYELAMARSALVRAAVMATVTAIAAWLVLGGRALEWLPVTFAVLAFVEWRGGVLRSGARRGLVAGGIALLLPISVLRPCCRMDLDVADIASSSCCTMPQACLAAGAILGFAIAVLMPRVRRGKRLELAGGVALGVASVATVRCASLFLGEATGLLAGLLVGVAAAALARAAIDRRQMAA